MLLLSASFALAADPVDVGVIKNSDIKVVQRILYSKEDKLEVGAALGVMPFDGSTTAPQLALSGTKFFSDAAGIELQVGGGYGLPTARYNELVSIGVAPEAYRYLASAEVDFQWTPIYAKMNLFGATILHHDVYLLGGVGATLEQSVLPAAQVTVAPTIPLGIGTRVWVGQNLAVRGELRDNLMIEHRAQTDTTAFKQNVAITLGLGFFTGGPSK
jgi:outer membrane beta-barrel protein